MSIAIIDYGVGNLRSVEKAFTSQGIDAMVTRDERVLREADKLVLLGVGAFGYAMESLRKLGFDRLVIEAADAGKPVIGICVGLQMMFEEGQEFGSHRGLGLLPGRVIKFPDNVRTPHVGWNQVEFKHESSGSSATCPTIRSSTSYTPTTSNRLTLHACWARLSTGGDSPRSAGVTISSACNSILKRARPPD